MNYAHFRKSGHIYNCIYDICIYNICIYIIYVYIRIYAYVRVCVCLCIQMQLGSYIHVTSTVNTHSLVPLQDLISTLATITFEAIHHATKVGIKSCRGARECISFVHLCTYVSM